MYIALKRIILKYMLDISTLMTRIK